MNQRLKRAAEEGDIDAFYAVIRESPNLLERIDKIPFVDTPLHLAASAGHTQFAMEMMRLKPSFARKPNPDGFSPMHLALQNGHTKMVIRFLEVDPDLVRVKGREGMSPLHYVAETGNLDLLAVFLSVCPKSMDDVTIRSQTALHIAVEKDMFEACEVLVGWLQRGLYEGGRNFRKKILNWKDEEGNTALHIATSNNSHKVVRLLVNNGVHINTTNLEGLTAVDIIERGRQLSSGEIKGVLCRAGGVRASRLLRTTKFADYLRLKKIPFHESSVVSTIRGRFYMSSEKRNTLLVVAVLIATTTYQAGLIPPRGVWQDDYKPPNPNTTSTTTMNPNTTFATTMTLNASSPTPHFAGEPILKQSVLRPFMYCNTMAFIISIAVIRFLLPLDSSASWLRHPLSMLVYCYVFSLVFPGSELDYFSFVLGSILDFFSVLQDVLADRKLQVLLHYQTPMLQ